MRSQPLLLILALFAMLTSCDTSPDTLNMLVFSKTEGFRHQSIEAGQEALKKMAAEKGFEVTFTEEGGDFNNANLRNYKVVLFLNTTGDVLNDDQQIAFERFIQAGGGYVGVHSATDTEYDWPWYGQLAGAYFLDHPSVPSNVQKGTFHVLEKDHWATMGMPDTFSRTDEFYSYRNISTNITPVLEIDETTYQGGSNPDFHPMSWYQEFDGGRSFYTGMGHTDETFEEPLFLDHLYAGIIYAAGGDNPQPLNYDKARSEENRFAKVVLADKLDEPIELTLLDEDRILFIQRKGEVMLFNKATEELEEIAKIEVSNFYKDKDGKESMGEDGLIGLNKDPNFADNQWIYLFYSPTDKAVNRLSRFTMDGDALPLSSEVVMLEVPVQREQCCHTGGSIAWDAQGNLYVSTGDNTNPHASSGYSPSDERPGRGPWDAQKSSANTNDLRGKILRIKPEADGSYSIPAGNLFPEGTANTRPEIYTMGHRNPYRISVDQRTGFVYWGDVGPDARDDDPTRGARGHDEVGQARGPGNFGWPHFIGDNKAYHKYDFAREESLDPWDAAAPRNTSPNNTGLEVLPPAQEAFIWYPYAGSEEFPLLGNGARNAMAGPVYYRDDFAGAPFAFPEYYDGRLFAYDWMRGFIYTVKMDDEGNYVSMDKFMPTYRFSNPMDMVFGDDGALYMLEYGTGWFRQNDDARLIKIEYNGGNRPPEAQLHVSTMGGAAPLTVAANADGSEDADEDELTYSWLVTSDNGFSESYSGKAISFTLAEEGIYEAALTVDDGNGGVVSQSLDLTVGNEPPMVALDLTGNRSFYTPGQPIRYAVKVEDAEDGSLGAGIADQRVAFSVDYLAEGFDKVAVEMGHRGADAGAMMSRGEALIAESDCLSCHKVASKSIGPTYLEIGQRYAEDENALEYLTGKIISGGGGVWGENAMAAHPDLATDEAADMVRYILGLAQAEAERIPLAGTYLATLPEGDPGKGVFILRGAYQDKGAGGLPSLGEEATVVLRNSMVHPFNFDAYEKVQKMSFGGMEFLMAEGADSYIMLEDIDLTGVSNVTVIAAAPKPQVNASGGTIELHLGAADGPLVGTSPLLEQSEGLPGMNGGAPPMLPIALSLPADADLNKDHDLYAVFKPQNDAEGIVMLVLGFIVGLDTEMESR